MYANSFGCEITTLNNDAVGLIFPEDYNIIPEVWVKPGDEKYGDAFKKFIAENCKIQTEFPKGHDIDHVLSRGQVNDPATYIRLMMVDYSANRSHGASIEKGFSKELIRLTDPENLNAIAYLKIKGEKLTKTLWKKDPNDRIKHLEQWISNKPIVSMVLQYLTELSTGGFNPDDNDDYITQIEKYHEKNLIKSKK